FPFEETNRACFVSEQVSATITVFHFPLSVFSLSPSCSDWGENRPRADYPFSLKRSRIAHDSKAGAATECRSERTARFNLCSEGRWRHSEQPIAVAGLFERREVKRKRSRRDL